MIKHLNAKSSNFPFDTFGTKRATEMIKHVTKNNSTFEVVVAAYQEKLDWIDKVIHPTTVYNKNDNPTFIPEIPKRARVVPLENIGRESHTYLHHIVQNYDTLADATIFCQGKPFDHCPKFLNVINRKDVVEMSDFCKAIDHRAWPPSNHDFCGIGHYWDFDLTVMVKQSWDLACKLPYCVVAMDVLYPRHIPLTILKSIWGANFVASKRTIHRFPKEKYQKLIDYHYEFWSFPWALESCWHHIFYEPDAPKSYF